MAEFKWTGGKPDFESWVVDGFGWDPSAGTSPAGTAENVAKKHGFTREESDGMAIARYQKYTDALKNGREFQKRYILPLDLQLSRKNTIVMEEDEGITPCTVDGMAKLKTKPGYGLLSGCAAGDSGASLIIKVK